MKKEILEFLYEMAPSCKEFYYYELNQDNKNEILMKHKDSNKLFATFYIDKIEKIINKDWQ
jgi:hypothetical protein